MSRLADCDRSRHIGRAVEILGAGIEEIECAWLQAFLGFGHCPVMDDRTIRASPRYGRKTQIAKIFVLAAERFEPVARSDLGEPAFWCLSREPREKARQRSTIAPMCGTRTLNFR